MQSIRLAAGRQEQAVVGIAVVVSLALLITMFVILLAPRAPVYVQHRCESWNGSMETPHCQSLKLQLDGKPWPTKHAWVATRRAMICADPDLVRPSWSGANASDAFLLEMARETVAAMDHGLPSCNAEAAFTQAESDWSRLERMREYTERERYEAVGERLPSPSTQWFWVPAMVGLSGVWLFTLVATMIGVRRYRGYSVLELGDGTFRFCGTEVALSRVEDIDVQADRVLLRLTEGTILRSYPIQLEDVDEAVRFCHEVLDARPVARPEGARPRGQTEGV